MLAVLLLACPLLVAANGADIPPPGCSGAAGAECGADSGSLLQSRLVSVHGPPSYDSIPPTYRRRVGGPNRIDRIRGPFKENTYPQSKCTFDSKEVPCYYWHPGTSYDTGAWAWVGELDVSISNTTGSTHEIAEWANESLSSTGASMIWITNQLNSYITVVTYEHPSFGNQTYFVSTDIQRYRLEDLVTQEVLDAVPDFVQRQGGLANAGVHKLLFSKRHRKEEGLAYLVFEFIDAVGVLDVATMTVVEIYYFPCESFGLERNISDDQNTMVCAGPHAVVEDKKGNLFIALKKVGGLAVLRNPIRSNEPVGNAKAKWYFWRMDDGPAATVRALPFAIALGNLRKEQFVYVNSITTSQIYVLKVTGMSWPPSEKLTAVDVSIVAEDGSRTNTRPAYLIGLENGGVIAASYNRTGLLLYVGPDGHFEPLDLPDQYRDGAYLAFCAGKSKYPFGSSVMDLKLLSSSNDFNEANYLPKNVTPSPQPDEVIVLTAVNPVLDAEQNCYEAATQSECQGKGGSCYWRVLPRAGPSGPSCRARLRFQRTTTYSAPTQNSYLHRVLCVEPHEMQQRPTGILTVVTELLTDRLMFVQETTLPLGSGPPR